MSENKPTNAQIKEFWKRFGLTEIKYQVGCHDGYNSLNIPIDLDTLFKYAVPKLLPKTVMMETVIETWEKQGQRYMFEFSILSEKQSGGLWTGYSSDPALALFWAIWEVIHGQPT